MDCAPSLSLITVNALAAVDGVIIPMQCEYYALEGLADLTQTIDRIQKPSIQTWKSLGCYVPCMMPVMPYSVMCLLS